MGWNELESPGFEMPGVEGLQLQVQANDLNSAMERVKPGPGVDILLTFSIVLHTPICSNNILPQFHFFLKHYLPAIFHFSHKKGATRRPFFTFSK